MNYMGAIVTVYCLERLTDYLQFERLCNDLMALEGYQDIAPLGGFFDKGRDAIYTDANKKSIFAYSVREDWKVKLSEDAGKIKKHGHACDELVFITTSEISSTSRDNAIIEIRETFGWELKIYGLERLRILLEIAHPELRENHPQIFSPGMLKYEITQPIGSEKHVYILYSQEDVIFAGWLAQKLITYGYRVWCNLIDHLVEDQLPDDIDAAIENQSTITISIISNYSLSDPEHVRQRSLALKVGHGHKKDSLIAVTVDDPFDISRLDRDSRALTPISFAKNWGMGLEQLIAKLDKVNCPKPLLNGKSVASKAFAEDDVISDTHEKVYLNCFDVIELPNAILRFKSEIPINYEDSNNIKTVWAHRRVGEHIFLSFFTPPSVILNKYDLKPSGGGLTNESKLLNGILVKDLISELLRKSLYVKATELGLKYCFVTGLYYFPYDLLKGNRLSYTKPDGTKTRVGVAGERKYWTPGKSDYYRYHLAPKFFVSQNLYSDFVITLRIGLRITDRADIPLESKKAFTRRKRLTNDWWNKEWGDRFFAVSQFFADGNEIVIGKRSNEVIRINAIPTALDIPYGINEEHLSVLKSQDIRLWAGEYEENDEDDLGEGIIDES